MKTLNKFEFKTSAVGESTYDWNLLLDGKIRELESGKDFTSSPTTFSTLARNAAKKMGYKVKLNVLESGNIVLQRGDALTDAEKAEFAASIEKGKLAAKARREKKKAESNGTPAAGTAPPAAGGAPKPKAAPTPKA